MTRVVVLGALGMLGHKVLQTLAQDGFDVIGTVRKPESAIDEGLELVTAVAPIHHGLDAMDFTAVSAALNHLKPDVVVNCVGVVKQKPLANDHIVSLTINSLLPHRLDAWCTEAGAKLVHFSTDCVFSGETGRYREDDFADARDLYGRSKYLGEVRNSPNSLTLRTSIIGRELSSFRSLVEWFYSQAGTTIKGFGKVLYSGITTLQASRVVSELIRQDLPAYGLYQLAGPWISKYDLLVEIQQQTSLDIAIERDDSVVSDRTMHGDRFVEATGIQSPDWPQMIADMVNDPTPYRGRSEQKAT